MREARLIETRLVALEHIDTSRRKRPVSDKAVAAIVASAQELGHIKDPVDLRRMKDGSLRLIAGGHRVSAARAMGWAEVRADIWDCSDDWAEMLEIDDNIAGADLTPLDTAIFLADRKRLYEKLHPETKRGVAGARGRWNASDTMSVAFGPATAEKLGLSLRQVYRMVAAGEKLDPRDRQLLRGAPRPVTIKDLEAISKITETVDRYDVVKTLAEGRAKSAAEALRQMDDPRPPKEPVEQAFQALLSQWARAPKAARRRFIEEAFDEVAEIVADITGGQA